MFLLSTAVQVSAVVFGMSRGVTPYISTMPYALCTMHYALLYFSPYLCYYILGDIMKTVIHPIEPVFDEDSEILILGTFPSVKSRETGFYYGHPQNRFWRVLAGVFKCETPITIEDKKRFLLDNNIALWDVIHTCEIEGSADSSIKNVVANNIDDIINNSRITKIITNGKKANELYNKYINTDIKCVCLPSTSPANAAWSLEKLIDFWSKELK